MSTESGLPDFRSAAGIWQEIDPTQVATIDAFRRDPERVWGWYGPRIRSFLDVEPNAGHHALARLERAGLVEAVVTQNIDTLHSRAGSVTVVEVHGSVRQAVCLTCGTAGAAGRGAGAARPRACADLPLAVARLSSPTSSSSVSCCRSTRSPAAEQLARAAALLLVVGSSLQVWPVAGLPEQTLASGGAVAILNSEPTPYDERATVVVHGPAGSTLRGVASLLAPDGASRSYPAGLRASSAP